MTAALLISISTLAATPTVTVSAADELTLDGKAWGEPTACKALAGQRVELSLQPGAAWDAVTPVVLEARRCGWRLAVAGADGASWTLLDRPAPPLLGVRASRTVAVVFEGAASEVELNTPAGLALLERAFPLGTPLCLYVLPTTPAATVLAAGAALTASGRRGLCLITDDQRSRLPAGEQTVLARLLGEELPATAAAPAPTGSLTRALGRSQSVAAVEREVPRWTNASSLICLEEGKPVLHGVGSVSGIKNHALARTTADNRARAEVARLISIELKRVEGGVSSFTAMTLSGVTILDHYFAEETVWALASLPAPEGFVAKTPCPTGSDKVRSWTWRGVAADGGTGSERPEWARDGLRLDADTVSFAFTLEPVGPVNETITSASALARLRLGESLLSASLAPPVLRSPQGVACLWSLPWVDAAAEAAIDSWQDLDSGALVVRASLSLGDLRAAVPEGCSADEVNAMAKRATSRREATTTTGDLPVQINYPDWVLRGSGAAVENGRRVFFGVGSVSGIKNHALARTTADNRARAEIAKVTEFYTAVSLKDYVSHAPKVGEVSVEQAIKTFAAATISGVQIVDHWLHPDGTVYALAELDLEHWQAGAAGAREVDARLREWVRKNAERLHAELEREESHR